MSAPRKRKVIPKPFGPARAREIWETRGYEMSLPDITPSEDAYVRQVQDATGCSTWINAFFLILNSVDDVR